ncbi:TPA: hypothetical protein DD449_01525 [Candidatus Berkelbacteria bacterium]|uniref:Uncharacterized protein n=1 Tax=Berkelbacteria bacterium GW2011_GWE1_39_12 TaxID=1618337 RepID=A0A0G4B3N3_9BACT|nr:MAG: hypothetical protein UT28_C0001G0781 [Berkelbacteria bacterium GW2011_GWE1_39_12]HBO60350.1 hypothetical protein [Candidatus Berkelbacteria bacterium]
MSEESRYPQGEDALAFTVDDLPVSDESKTTLTDFGIANVGDIVRVGKTAIDSLIGGEETERIHDVTRQMGLESAISKQEQA